LEITPLTPKKGEKPPIEERKERISRKRVTKKELMKRVEELEEALRTERERAETYLRQLKYAKADLENLRKMVKRQVEEAVRSGNERLIRELLVVLDDLELALEAGGKTGDREALMEGVEMVLRKFRKILESEGLKPIEALGRPFNPDLHEAVMRVEDPDRPEGVVIEEVRRGYMLRGKVIRPSMVKVSVNPRREEKEGARDG